MPDDCVEQGGGIGPANEPSDGDHVECYQRVAAEAGNYELSLDAYTACVEGDELCTCDTTDPDGTCRVSDGFAATLTGKKLSAKTTFTMPSPGVVEVRFEGELCQPSSNTMPCAEYGAEGCCQGETCAVDPMGERRCMPVSSP
jgi:hypothetical protein